MSTNDPARISSTARKRRITSLSDAVIDPVSRELRAESITVRIRWFGLAIGYLLVNIGDFINATDRHSAQFELNAILTLGTIYAIIDTIRSWKGHVFLAEFRIVISMMEALFIGVLCYFDEGLSSPFRFYYFLSLLVCAIRHSPALTFATFGLHALSYSLLGLFIGTHGSGDAVQMILTLVFMGWAAWAIISLTGLLKTAGFRLEQLNKELLEHQAYLERRIQERTKELQQSQALLVQQEKQAAFGLLAAGIAHEVGNPLAAISSIVQILNRRNTDDYTRERLEMVGAQLGRIQRILQELVGFSRPTNQQPTLFDLHRAIEDALNIAKYYKRWKGKKVTTDFSPEVKGIRTVYDQLVQVILNLVMNALDATEEGAGIQVRTTLETEESGMNVVAIYISDEGHGISESAQSQIFEPYFTTKSTGTGLGLFVCRQLAEQELRGSISLVRSNSTGTEFRIALPALP
ncbi:MAG: two-component sensor histidine kinase [Planctomycetaceae bacterium]|nr:two-component sensor histidine kinase [Planctomycetaceae bacterium]